MRVKLLHTFTIKLTLALSVVYSLCRQNLPKPGRSPVKERNI